MPIDVGQIVANKYELVRLLGRGSMGEVWSAHHKALNEQVAVKLLAWPPSGEDAEEPPVALARFRFEAQVAARLSRKTRHIARVTDYGEDDGLPYLVMELLDGEALDAALKARGPVPFADATEIVSQMARALGQAHAEGVAHRDLKPANVFLTHDEEGRLLVKLLDFGIARSLHARRPQGTFSTAKGFVFGTPGYMSPEQTRASPALDHRCDLWALATIAYQMLTGELPVHGNDADEVMKNVCAGRIIPVQDRDARIPAAVGAFFDRAFADRVDDRFDGAAGLAQAFDLACRGGTSGAMSAPSMPSLADSSGSTAIEFAANVADEPPQVRRRHPPVAALGVAGVLAALAVTVAGVRAVWRTPGSAPPLSDTLVVPAPAPSPEPSAKAAGAIAVPESAPLPSTEGAPATSSAQPSERPAEKVAAPAPAKRGGPPTLGPVPSAAPRPDAPPARPLRASPRPVEDRNDVF
jgi:serine/threonine-protein kinase